MRKENSNGTDWESEKFSLSSNATYSLKFELREFDSVLIISRENTRESEVLKIPMKLDVFKIKDMESALEIMDQFKKKSHLKE